MTNEELLIKIREEIESRIKELHEAEIDYREDQCDTIVSCLVSGISELQRVLTLLNTLEKSLPSKVADGEDLDDLITRELANVYGTYTTPDYMEKDTTEESCYFESYIARHFYDLGCRRTAEKYDELEYNRQRAEESPLPEDTVLFNNGVEEGKRQMLKETVDAEVIVPIYEGKYEGNDVWSAEVKIPGRYEVGDKVRVIILPKED